MSDRIVIEADKREIVGKKVSRLRRDGIVPGIIYGSGEPINVQMDNLALHRALRVAGKTQLVEVNVSGGTHTVLVREIQQHLTRGDLVHVDFLEVDLKATIESTAALISVGISEVAGVPGAAILAQHEIDYESLPDDLVSEIEVDISAIESPDDIITVADLIAPKGIVFLTDPDTIVARFQYEALEEEEETEEDMVITEADEVEVIGRDREDEEDFED